jgi:hypothetical protein
MVMYVTAAEFVGNTSFGSISYLVCSLVSKHGEGMGQTEMWGGCRRHECLIT